MIRQYIRYLKDNPKGYWFKAKLYGWGWVPATWQGWLITLVYLIAVLFFALTIDTKSPVREIVFTFVLPVALLTITFIRICYKKGENPNWNWGTPDQYKRKKNK